jgi:hypothetical protein
MQSVRHLGVEDSRVMNRAAPLDHCVCGGQRRQPPAATEAEIVRRLAAWSGRGADVLVYGAPAAEPAETHC